MQGVEQVDPETAHRRQEAGVPLVDVREAYEREDAHIPGSLWVPLSAFAQGWTDLPEVPLVLYCAVGGRSQQAAAFLRMQGREAANFRGGIVAWTQRGLPTRSGEG